jgi:hypothetical protein
VFINSEENPYHSIELYNAAGQLVFEKPLTNEENENKY